jgi:hypothetical protein
MPDAVRDQVLSGFIGPGLVTQEFAAAPARFVGAERAVATVSGPVALSAAANALRLEPGDEILVPAYGVISTINGFASADHLTPRRADHLPFRHPGMGVLSSADRRQSTRHVARLGGRRVERGECLCDAAPVVLVLIGASFVFHRFEITAASRQPCGSDDPRSCGRPWTCCGSSRSRSARTARRSSSISTSDKIAR